MPFTFGRPSGAYLESVAGRGAGGGFNYDRPGSTRAEDFASPGDTHYRLRRDLGSGAGVWERACTALDTWVAQHRAGVRVWPAGAPVEEGSVVVVDYGLGPLHMVGACRVVYTVREDDRHGYAYGTLDGHPEAGEESFRVLRRGPEVSLEISVRYRLVALAARMGGPVSRSVQARATRLYLEGIEEYSRADAVS